MYYLQFSTNKQRKNKLYRFKSIIHVAFGCKLSPNAHKMCCLSVATDN